MPKLGENLNHSEMAQIARDVTRSVVESEEIDKPSSDGTAIGAAQQYGVAVGTMFQEI
jgi:hypothetical protein